MAGLKILLLLFIVTTPVFAAPDLMSFADSLAAEQDHYRAITEYKRFLHYFPDDPRAPSAQLKIGQSFVAGERWQQADLAFEKVWSRYPKSPEAAVARRAYAEAAFQRKDYETARDRYAQLKQEQHESDTAEVSYRSGLSELQLNHPAAARLQFEELEPELAHQLSLSIDQYENLPQKSPRLAGTLSAILPGAGQLYSERPKQAGIAFALNAAFIYAAVEAYENDNYAVSGILSLFELGWYGGNIYSAINNAHKYNRRQRQTFLDNFQQRFGLTLRTEQGIPKISAHFSF
ncbi:MAG: tetratricopeptide repeat protein [Desulfuromonadales bacterium]|nr:tetratricopeptide repeat protein [Desulfuromonadales bacterium]MBN2792546.1 tetratricopeptide repeat protein [Desulfuromonadales bacterium]